METFAFRWFSLIYPMLGLLLVLGGIWLIARVEKATVQLNRMAEEPEPPAAFVTLIRFLMMMTLPSLLFAVWPLSWPELIFSVWCLVILFTGGQILVHWQATAEAIRTHSEELPRKLRLIAANMLSIGLILFLLFYHLLSSRPG